MLQWLINPLLMLIYRYIRGLKGLLVMVRNFRTGNKYGLKN